MRKKLICFDLDGTLLDDNKRIPKNNIRAIEGLLKEGHLVSIATGRLYKSAKKVREKLPKGVEIICSNGAVLEKDNRIVRIDRISPDLHSEIYDLVKSHGLHLTFDSLYAAYHTSLGNTIRFDYFMNRLNKGSLHIKNLHCRNKDEYMAYAKYFINGIIISSKFPKKLKKLRDDLEGLNLFNIESSHESNVEIIPKTSNKGVGAKILGEFHDLGPEDIIAFGDAENDLKLIEGAGISVAMGNASDQIKKAATMITDTNNNDGIPKALEKIFGHSFI